MNTSQNYPVRMNAHKDLMGPYGQYRHMDPIQGWQGQVYKYKHYINFQTTVSQPYLVMLETILKFNFQNGQQTHFRLFQVMP